MHVCINCTFSIKTGRIKEMGLTYVEQFGIKKKQCQSKVEESSFFVMPRR